jgi:hypothetical protein
MFSFCNSSAVLTESQNLDIISTRVTIYGIVMLPVSIVGLLLNIFTVVVLLHPRLRNFSTNAYLTALSISNVVCLFYFITSYSIRYLMLDMIHDNRKLMGTQFPIRYESGMNFSMGILAPLSSIFQFYGFYLTCAVTIDRFIYVTWPLKADKICTLRNAFKSIFGLFVFSLLYNFPRWFEITHSIDHNETLKHNITIYKASYTKFARSCFFKYFMRKYGYLMFVYGLPFTILVLANIVILIKLCKADTRKKNLLGHNRKSIANVNGAANRKRESEIMLNAKSSINKKISNQQQQKRVASKKTNIILDTRITVMIVAVVIVFFICQFPYLIINIVSGDCWKEFAFNKIKIYCDLLTAINCCSNFVIYCFFGQKFRETAKELLCNPSFSPYLNSKKNMRNRQYSRSELSRTTRNNNKNNSILSNKESQTA